MKLLLRRLSLALVASLAALALGEGLVRRFHPQPGYDYPRGLFIADAEVGYRVAPNFRGVMDTRGVEIAIATNEEGLRGPPLRERGDGHARLLLLGDSFTFGFAVPYSGTFAAHLSAQLETELRGVEVLTAASPGYGPHEELALARQLLPRLRPDALVYYFFAGNDILDALEPPGSRTVLRGFLLSRTKAERYQGTLGTWRFELAHTWQGLHLVRLLEPGRGAETWTQTLRDFHPDHDARAQGAWLATRLALDGLAQLCAEAQVPLLIVTLPAALQIRPELRAQTTATEEVSPEQLLWPQQFVSDWARQQKLPFRDVTATAQTAQAEQSLFPDWDEHFNSRGNALVAEETRDLLEKSGILESLRSRRER